MPQQLPKYGTTNLPGPQYSSTHLNAHSGEQSLNQVNISCGKKGIGRISWKKSIPITSVSDMCCWHVHFWAWVPAPHTPKH